MTKRELLFALSAALAAACGGGSTDDFPIPTRYILTWTCSSGDCSIQFPYAAYEQMVLRDSGGGEFEANFFGASCSAVTSCQLETGPCASVAGEMVDQLACAPLAACGVEGESLSGLVLCSDTESEMEAEPIEVSDPDSGEQARYDLHVQIFR